MYSSRPPGGTNVLTARAASSGLRPARVRELQQVRLARARRAARATDPRRGNSQRECQRHHQYLLHHRASSFMTFDMSPRQPGIMRRACHMIPVIRGIANVGGRSTEARKSRDFRRACRQRATTQRCGVRTNTDALERFPNVFVECGSYEPALPAVSRWLSGGGPRLPPASHAGSLLQECSRGTA